MTKLAIIAGIALALTLGIAASDWQRASTTGTTWATDYSEQAGSAFGKPLAAIITALEQPYTKQKEQRNEASSPD